MRTGVFCLVATVMLSPFFAFSQDALVGRDGNIRNIDTRSMILEGGAAYLATRCQLYRSGDVAQFEKWDEVFSLPAGENEITALGGRGRTVLLGTKRGLYRTVDSGKSWRNVFRTIIPEKNHILSIQASEHKQGRFVISTARGIFCSDDGGSRWSDISFNLRNKAVRFVALNGESMYASLDEGVYLRRADNSGWERIYVGGSSSSGETGDEASYDTASEEIEAEAQAARPVAVAGQRVYIGDGRAVKYSDNFGSSWTALNSSGISGLPNYILIPRRSAALFCATTRGVFEYDGKKWAELYRGMDKRLDVTGLLFTDREERALWALSERGLYRMDTGRFVGGDINDVEKGLRSFRIAYSNEPDFRKLQEAAMRFCDVTPEKISTWQRNSRIKALVPKVSLGVNRDRSTNTEIYTSATRDYAVVGPEDSSSGLDVTVSWDLGNLIYSDDQTGIDARSRLNTQLRNDILDDLRRIYFERKRLQFEAISSPPKEIRSRVEKELRIQELTQAIDDLTGNYLSDNTVEKPAGDRSPAQESDKGIIREE